MKPSMVVIRACSTAALAFAALGACTATIAQTEETLYRFQNNGDGYGPLAGMVADSKGNLYGTASDYGSGAGTIFEMSPPVSGGPWTFTALYTLNGTTDGAEPRASLLRDSSGNLYGTTALSGTECGTAFELSPPSVSGEAWSFKVLYSFAGGSDGCYAAASLVMDPTGNLYGTTENGGNNNNGTVFELSPPSIAGGAWTETVLYRFGSRSDDGLVPAAAVTFGKGGWLYGTTFWGGAKGAGTVFALQPPSASGGAWREHILHHFAGGTRGGEPGASVVFDSKGNLYGTAVDAPENSYCSGILPCGRVYALSPPTATGNPWTYSTIWAFTGESDGANPYDPVTFDGRGNLYGTTALGGVGGGTVFELAPPAPSGGPWTETTLYQFALGLDGSYSWGDVIFGGDGRLYGGTFTSGIMNCYASFGGGGCGTVFRLTR
jgi:uncharacterized repeat protein (TIGR03803 family)